MGGGGGGGVEETPDQIQEQKNNVQLWNYYQTSYKPYIDKHIKQTSAEAASPDMANKAAGQVNAEVMKGASANQPGQGNPVNLTRQLTNAAGVGSEATATAQGKVRQLQNSNLQNIVDIGRGQQTSAMQGQAQLAGQSLQSAMQNKETDLMTDAAIENGIGSAVGAGAAVYGRALKDPGQLYKDAGGNINKVDFNESGPEWGSMANP